jgi:hypothetical protein
MTTREDIKRGALVRLGFSDELTERYHHVTGIALNIDYYPRHVAMEILTDNGIEWICAIYSNIEVLVAAGDDQ